MKNCLSVSVITAGLFTTAVYAQPTYQFSITPIAEYSLRTDLNDDTSFSVLRTGAMFAMGAQVDDSFAWAVDVGGEYNRYAFDDDSFAEEFYFFSVRPSVSKYLNENFGIYGGLLLAIGGEADADVSDSMVYGGFAGFNYRIGKNVWVGTGIAVSTQLSDDPIFVPLINIDWAINDQWRLTASGLSARLTYQIDPQWAVFAEARLDMREFRLSDDSSLPEGAFSDDAVPVGVGIGYSPNDNINIAVTGGWVVWRQVQLYDLDDDKIFEDTADPTAYARASVKISW